MARAKRTARAEARRRYRAEHPQEADGLDDAEDLAELDDAPPARGRATSRPDRAPEPSRQNRGGALRAFRDAYQPADIRADLRALPELIRSRAVLIPALLVVISLVIVLAAAQNSLTNAAGLTDASASPGTSASIAPSAAATSAPSAGASVAASPAPGASPAPSGAASSGTGTESGSPLGIIASILALLFLGVPPPAIGGIYIAAILAKRSSYLAGGIAGLLAALGFSVYVLALKLPPELAAPNIDQLKGQAIQQALLTSPIFGIVIGAGLGYYRRLLRLMNPTPNRPANRSKQAARRR